MIPTSDLGKGITANTQYTGENNLPLPVLDDGQVCLSCWKLSWKERLQVLLFGRIWLCIGGTQPPVWLKTTVKDVFEE